MRLQHTPSFCSRCFLFGLSPLTTSYISPVVATCPSGKTWNRVRCSVSLSSPIFVFHLCCPSLSQSLTSAWCVFAWCGLSLVCFHPVCFSAQCVSYRLSCCLVFSLVACLATRTPTVRLLPTRRSTDPDFVQKGPGFDHDLFAACLPLSIHRLWDSGIVLCPLG